MAESTSTVETTTTTEDTTVESVTMTQAELDALLQKEGDKRVAQAMKTMQKKQAQADRLKNMSDDERHQFELDERERAIEAKEKEIALTEMKATATSILSAKGLDISLVDLVVNEDGEITNENIKKLEKAFKASVKKEVEQRLGTNAPKKPSADPDTITKEQFSKMSLIEKQNLFSTNKDVYMALINS